MTIRIRDAVTSASIVKPLQVHAMGVLSAPDGLHITSGSEDRAIQIWNAETGAVVARPLVGHTCSVPCIAYSPNGQSVVSRSRDKATQVWDLFPYLPENAPVLTRCMFVFMHGGTQTVGSKTQRVVYYIGYPQTAVEASIYMFSLIVKTDRAIGKAKAGGLQPGHTSHASCHLAFNVSILADLYSFIS